MTAAADPLRPGLLYLTEGGTETEIMYRYGHPLRDFAAFELLDDINARADLVRMYDKYLHTAAKYGTGVLMAGVDFRANTDWGVKLGYDAVALADLQRRCIDFLREAVVHYLDSIPHALIAGGIGPRGDAFSRNQPMTAEEAEAYHSSQIATLKSAYVDILWAGSIDTVAEAVGLARAAHAAAVPLTISFTLDGSHRLPSGPSLRDAIEATDAEAGAARPAFYGINGTHPAVFAPILEAGDWIQRLRSIRANASEMDTTSPCKIASLGAGDPEALGRQLGDVARRFPHIAVWGGSHGTWEAHLEEIARRVGEARAAA